MRTACSVRLAWLCQLGLALTVWVLAASSFFGVGALSQSPAPGCLPNLKGSHDYQGRTLAKCNFNGLDLNHANFRNATLSGVIFVNANLSSADFSGATFADSGSQDQATDFSFANLTHATFVGTRFKATTYLTQATLACTDFSQTDFVRGKAIFGDEPLVLAAPGAAPVACKTSFHDATMNCEFVPQWNRLDLSGAVISACGTELQTTGSGAAGHDFSGAMLNGVVFDGLDLSRSRWNGAAITGASFRGSTLDDATGLANQDLTKTVFSSASLKRVVLNGARLHGAVLDEANLDGAKLQGALLSPCPLPPSTSTSTSACNAASLRGAYLRNADLSGSDLSYVSFNSASFYGSQGAGTGSCFYGAGPAQCASANGAILTQTDFTDAYLYGVDFGSATMHGVKFDNAVLVAANFAQATVQARPGETGASFANAFLQGADLSGARVDSTTFTGAFVDFNTNLIVVQLNAAHTRFAGSAHRGLKVCTEVVYATGTRMPPARAGLICPDASTAVANGGCGPVVGQPVGQGLPWTSHWNNGLSLSQSDPLASYDDNTAPSFPDRVVPKWAACTPDQDW